MHVIGNNYGWLGIIIVSRMLVYQRIINLALFRGQGSPYVQCTHTYFGYTLLSQRIDQCCGSGIRIRILIQHYKWIRIQIQGFDDQKMKGKNTAENFLTLFWSKIAIYLSPGLHKGRPSYRRSLEPSKENNQHFKRWNSLAVFYFECMLFCTGRVLSLTL